MRSEQNIIAQICNFTEYYTKMTYEEAVNLKSYKNHCNCGGYAGLSDRAKSAHPHLSWCAQYEEFEARAAALAKAQYYCSKSLENPDKHEKMLGTVRNNVAR